MPQGSEFIAYDPMSVTPRLEAGGLCLGSIAAPSTGEGARL
jgi:hypothetical protein